MTGSPAESVEVTLREAQALLSRNHRSPHDVLGAHAASRDGLRGAVVRALDPGARSMSVVVGDDVVEMQLSNGVFTAFLPGRTLPFHYTLRSERVDGTQAEREDPYRFLPTVGEVDLHLIGEGNHLGLWSVLGSHLRTIDGVDGASFAVWAPNATGVSLTGSFNCWDGRVHMMRALGSSGVFELFVPGVTAGAAYKYEIRAPDGRIRVKTDPVAFTLEQGSGHASIVTPEGGYSWEDEAWLKRRRESDPARSPMLVYEVHLASWARGDGNRMLSYREIAPPLAAHVKALGFTHIELLPVQEHPYGGSWGYQVGGYFAPTGRHGSADDFRSFVDTMHQAGIGVLLDWVPAHFPRDDWALRRFDGTACYEHEDPRLGEHPEWGTMIFNYGRNEVRNFLLANALYWVEEYHIDGLRVDAVASMLYLDYGRDAGQWLRNRFGGRENLEAVAFLKQLNHIVRTRHPGVITIAEESTTWPRVTHPIAEGGLGFSFKWNMGWMHDTLDFFGVDPLFRRGVHDRLTFAMMYEYSERFMNPLSHDEVVHLKKSLLEKMPGDVWRKFANLRALIGYSITRPGKSLFFMGTELAPHREWNHDASLPWSLTADPRRRGLALFISELGALYNAQSCFWRDDHVPAGFSWIDVSDKEQSVVSYARFDGAEHAVVIMNLTPVPRSEYRIGVPAAGVYRCVINSDAEKYGGSGYEVPESVTAESSAWHGFAQSVELVLPPLSIMVFLHEKVETDEIAQGDVAVAEVEAGAEAEAAEAIATQSAEGKPVKKAAPRKRAAKRPATEARPDTKAAAKKSPAKKAAADKAKSATTTARKPRKKKDSGN